MGMADIDRHSGMEKLRDMPQGSPEDVKMLGLFMDVGAMMIRNGSEVKRVEDTLRRMGAAYGAERMDVFAITSTLVCTMNMPYGSVCSMTRGTRDGTKTDFPEAYPAAIIFACVPLPAPGAPNMIIFIYSTSIFLNVSHSYQILFSL